MKKRIMIAAGGTGGHIYPAISIIEYLKKSGSAGEILFIGTSKGMEKEFAQKHNISFTAVKASGFSASGSIYKKLKVFAKFLIDLISGFTASVRAIKKFKPDIILGMGGYVCAPVLLAAIFLGKKIAIHEQNYIPGRLNRYFAGFSSYIFISFKGSEKYFKLKKHGKKIPEIIYSGNPIRESVRQFRSLKPDYDRWGLEKSRKTILAFGGSLGAERLNACVLSLYGLLRQNAEFQIVLICGNRFYDIFNKKLNDMAGSGDSLIFRLYPYIDDMEKLYRITDIVIARAGATTVAELDYIQIPAILIPYPEAVEDHQFFNAGYLSGKDMASVILDRDLTPDMLLNEIERIASQGSRKMMKDKDRQACEITDAAALISDKITEASKITGTN